MRKLLLILSTLFLLSGCALIQAQKDNWEACKADPSCYASAEKWKETGQVVGGLAGSAFPGAAMPAQQAGGWIAFALAMLVGGHALKKKENQNG